MEFPIVCGEKGQEVGNLDRIISPVYDQFFTGAFDDLRVDEWTNGNYRSILVHIKYNDRRMYEVEKDPRLNVERIEKLNQLKEIHKKLKIMKGNIRSYAAFDIFDVKNQKGVFDMMVILKN